MTLQTSETRKEEFPQNTGKGRTHGNIDRIAKTCPLSTGSCAQGIVRSSKPRYQCLEQRKLYCRAMHGDGSACVRTRAHSVTQSCPTLCNPMDYSPGGLFCPRDCPGKDTGAVCHFLSQGIFLGIKPVSLASPALVGRFFATDAT